MTALFILTFLTGLFVGSTTALGIVVWVSEHYKS